MGDGPADRIGRRIKEITTDLKRYAEKRLELIALNIGEQSARMIAESAHKIAGLVFMFGALIFLLIALALYIGALLNSRSLGFVIVSIPFLIGGYLLLNLKPAFVTRKIRSQFEEEFADFIDTTEPDEKKKLIASDSPELQKKNEHKHNVEQ